MLISIRVSEKCARAAIFTASMSFGSGLRERASIDPKTAMVPTIVSRSRKIGATTSVHATERFLVSRSPALAPDPLDFAANSARISDRVLGVAGKAARNDALQPVGGPESERRLAVRGRMQIEDRADLQAELDRVYALDASTTTTPVSSTGAASTTVCPRRSRSADISSRPRARN